MALTSGARIGPYGILSPLGAGGMGEVYRARDTKLGRDVAIKVLPEHLADDRDRLARFEREAQLLASLNHPHIAAVHGFEQAEDFSALVLELVEGPTLADLLAQGPLPVDDALAIARQIVDALEAAHDQGIVHRDLKPSNIKVRPDGTVKVLDFGLAKLADPIAGPSSGALSLSPTITSPAVTVAGVILGTAAYMSPEQARGKTVDRRSDIWAFGCVLFEMLSAHRAFEGGDNISDVVAAILKNEPDWSLLGTDVPPRVHALLRRCLRKDPRKRLPHIAVVRLELEEADDGDPKTAPAAGPPAWKRALPVSVATVVTGLLVGLVMWALRPAVPAPQVLRFPIVVPSGTFIDRAVRAVAVSPDGTRVAMAAGGRIFLRTLAEDDARPIAGSEVTQGYLGEPVFSPDGDELVYWTGTAPERATLKRISVNGGSAVTVATASFAFGTTWGARGIVFAQGAGLAANRILRVPSEGGTPETLVTLAEGEAPSSPQILPGGDAVLFTLSPIRGVQDLTQESWDRSRVVVHDLGSGQRKTIIDGGSDARYVPTGHRSTFPALTDPRRPSRSSIRRPVSRPA
jgi:eukaryotic-like serine/threonine-protein kinase